MLWYGETILLAAGRAVHPTYSQCDYVHTVSKFAVHPYIQYTLCITVQYCMYILTDVCRHVGLPTYDQSDLRSQICFLFSFLILVIYLDISTMNEWPSE